MKSLILQGNDLENLASVLDWAIMEGYNIDKNKNIIELFKTMIKEGNLNNKTDNYYRERYGFE